MPHPTHSIIGEYSDSLRGRCVVLGVTGSVALYRSLDTARWLLRRGARVRVVMTRPAAELVSPRMFHWATAEEPIVDLTGRVEHIELASECDSMLVAPATLSTMSKIACGITDNPVALTAVSMRSEDRPVAIAPAMHSNMASSLQYEQAITVLARQGYVVIPPHFEAGVAKYRDPKLLARLMASITLRGRDLEGLRVLVTAGPTREWLDPVRFISNPSSGLMGLEAALEAYARGAEVKLIHGPMSMEVPSFLESTAVETTEEMAAAVREATERTPFDVIIAAAAPADFRPASRWDSKIRSGAPLELKLEPTPKVIGSIARRPRVLVAFAAETAAGLGELESLARAKMEKYGADVMVANIVGLPGLGFSAERERGVIMARWGFKRSFESMLKEDIARLIFDLVLEALGGGGIGEGHA